MDKWTLICIHNSHISSTNISSLNKQIMFNLRNAYYSDDDLGRYPNPALLRGNFDYCIDINMALNAWTFWPPIHFLDSLILCLNTSNKDPWKCILFKLTIQTIHQMLD